MLLHEMAPIVGLWCLMGEGPRSALISFRWGRDGIEGAELDCHTPLSGRVDATSWARICPARGLNTAVWVETDGGHATVTMYSAGRQRLHKSPSAEAAAAVAIAGATAVSVALCLYIAEAVVLTPRQPDPCMLPACPSAGQVLPAGHLATGQL
jgi:hypothetical protein